ncbi:MAG: TraR/DksA family transcriptional regulator [Bdellovibrio sp.]|jgi:DnaK suppressor protein
MSQSITNELSSDLIVECKRRLLTLKQDLLNRFRSGHMEFAAHEKASGDEIDQTMAQLAENNFLAGQERLRTQLMEIDYALARIQNGTFGTCEETGEPIEHDRLLALPYTRLSIEGAEMRESVGRRYAR